MKNKSPFYARIALAALAAVFVTAIILIIEVLRVYLPGLWKAFSSGSEGALREFLNGSSRLYGSAVLWLLTFVQVLSVFIPAMPVQLVAGMTCGIILGFLITFSASVAANMLVYAVAHRMNKLLSYMASEHPKLEKMLGILKARRDSTFFTILAILTPGLPNGIIPYAAANSDISAKAFLIALVTALPIPTLLTCIAGRLVMSGDWIFSAAIIAGLYIVVGFLLTNKNRVLRLAERLLHRRKRAAKERD